MATRIVCSWSVPATGFVLAGMQGLCRLGVPVPLRSRQDIWKRTIEIQIRKSKSNELTVDCGWYSKEKMKTVLKFSPWGPCVNPAGLGVQCVYSTCICMCLFLLVHAKPRKRIQKVVKFCTQQKRVKTHTRPASTALQIALPCVYPIQTPASPTHSKARQVRERQDRVLGGGGDKGQLQAVPH